MRARRFIAAALAAALAPVAGMVMRPPAPKVELRALHSSPPSSVHSYISQLRVVRVCAVISWPSTLPAHIAGHLIEAARRPDLCGTEWSESNAQWEPVVDLPLDGSATSHVVELDPGITYAFRVAALSETDGQLPFSEPTETVSALGMPAVADSETGCYLPYGAESTAAAASRNAPASDRGDQPWDSVGSTGLGEDAPHPDTPTPFDHARSDSWDLAGACPLLSLVPTTAELALLQAQASLLAAVRTFHDGAGREAIGEGAGARLRLDVLPPGLNKIIEHSHAYSEPLLGLTALALADALRGLRVQVRIRIVPPRRAHARVNTTECFTHTHAHPGAACRSSSPRRAPPRARRRLSSRRSAARRRRTCASAASPRR